MKLATVFFIIKNQINSKTLNFLVMLLLVLCYGVIPKSMLDSNKITEEYTAVQKS